MKLRLFRLPALLVVAIVYHDASSFLWCPLGRLYKKTHSERLMKEVLFCDDGMSVEQQILHLASSNDRFLTQ